LFVFTFVFEIRVLARTETVVPQLPVFVGVMFGFFCIGAFLYLIDYAARFLRPISLLHNIGREGRAVLDSVYPENLIDTKHPVPSENQSGPVTRITLHEGDPGIVKAVRVQQLIRRAAKAGEVWDV